MPWKALHLLLVLPPFNPRVCTYPICPLSETSLVPSVLCLKFFRDVSHTQNKTHAHSMVFRAMCGLLPAVPVTSSASIHCRCPWLCSNKPSPAPWVSSSWVSSQKHCPWLSTPESCSLHQSHHPQEALSTSSLSHPSLSCPHASYLISLTVTFVPLSGYHPRRRAPGGHGPHAHQ